MTLSSLFALNLIAVSITLFFQFHKSFVYFNFISFGRGLFGKYSLISDICIHVKIVFFINRSHFLSSSFNFLSFKISFTATQVFAILQ